MAQQTLTDVTTDFSLDIFNDSGCLVELNAIEFQANHPNASVQLETGRYWSLGSGTCTSGFNGSLTLPVTFTPDGNDKVCRYTGIGIIWDCKANGFTSTTISRDGISAFSDWTGGNDAGPTALVLERFTARPENWVGIVGVGGGLLVGIFVGLGWVFYKRKQA
ncbi:MAG: hypothetical protein Fur0022_07210 [Anaerolineales bacterium]